MQVYGDLERRESAAGICSEIEERLSQVPELPSGLDQHQALVAAFIRLGELVQGLCDAQFHQDGMDDLTPVQQHGAALLRNLAGTIDRSWRSGFAEIDELRDFNLDPLRRDEIIQTKQAEGYAFYALYPESYSEAARRSSLRADTQVIGIRSIGAGLAALVAAALDAPPPVTVRPVGHPYDRQLSLSDALADHLRRAGGSFAIVDEGPGLSGSSFNCVADWLVAQGVSEDRIHFFPSHMGPLGPAARPEHQSRWDRANRHHVDFTTLLVSSEDRRHRLSHWFDGLLGSSGSTWTEVSGGNWRKQVYSSAEEWPPVDASLEKRKYLHGVGGESFLVKFSGIGSVAEPKETVSRQLFDAGFAPEPLGMVHGFAVQRWIGGRVLKRSETLSAPLQNQLADYISLRARLPPDGDGDGAALKDLFSAAAFNIGQHMGQGAEHAIRERLGAPERFAVYPCCTDNRLHRWEWRVGDGERLIKTDAVDHHAAHDFIGCQDITWDIAGACVELGLSRPEQALLASRVAARSGSLVSAELLEAMTICYLGFQIGLWTFALQRAGEGEQPRIHALLDAYASHPAIASGSSENRFYPQPITSDA